MKILFLDHEHRVGGAELMLLRFLQKCERTRIAGEIVLPQEGPFAEMARESGVPVHIVPMGGGMGSYRRGPALPELGDVAALCGMVRKLRGLFRSLRPDLIISNTMKAHVYGTIATAGMKTPYAWRLHDVIDEREFSPLQRRLMRICARFGPDAIAGVSSAVCRPFPGGKVRVIYNGVETPEVPRAGAVEEFRRENGLGTEVVTVVGRLMPAKGQRVFVEAAERLHRLRPGTHFLIVGDEFGSEGFREELRQTVEKAGISARTTFLPFQKELSLVYGCSSVVVVPSITPESLPTVILEAMAYGVPVVASRIGGAGEIVEDGVSGRLFPVGDAALCASSILGILSDHSVRARLREKALEKVRERFSMAGHIAAMTDWLESVARGGSANLEAEQ